MNDWNKNLDEIEPFGRDDLPGKISINKPSADGLIKEPAQFLGNPNDYDINPEYIDYLNNEIETLAAELKARDDLLKDAAEYIKAGELYEGCNAEMVEKLTPQNNKGK